MGIFAFRRKRKKEEVKPVKVSESLADATVPELKEIAKGRGIEGYSQMKRKELIEALQK